MSVEKSIAIYDSEQAEAYENAVRELKERGKIEKDAAEGAKLATLAREYTKRFEHNGNHNASQLRDFLSALGIALPLAIYFMLAFGVIIGVFLGISYLIGPIPPL